MAFGAIVLAGGQASRLGGVDKAGIEVAGRRLIDRVVDALVDAQQIVVVGPLRDVIRPVVWTREQPPGGGPVAAVAAGLDKTVAQDVIVTAVDLPWLDRDVVGRLMSALVDDVDGAIATDEGGRDQPLLAAYHSDALRLALDRIGYVVGAPMNSVVAQMKLARVAEPEAARDCDTWDDVARASGEVRGAG